MTRVRSAGRAAAFFWAATLAFVPLAWADEIEELSATILELERDAQRLDVVVSEPEQPAADAAERRLLEAQVLFEIKDYARASILFLDVVEKYANSRAHEDALYYLAESLFRVRNLRSAKPYYLEIAARPQSPHYRSALARLVEIALRTGETAGVDNLIARMGEVPQDPRQPSSPYVRAKYLYFSGRTDEAIKAFDAISNDHQYGRHARYFAGVSRVKKDDFEGAIESFQRLGALKPRTDGEKKIRDLGILALGRVRYERGQLRQAIAAFETISRESDLYDTALYEIAWVYVKDKQFENALRSLDLLLISAPESPRVPEIRILRGNLLVRLNRFDDATKDFRKTRDDYQPQYEELRAIMEGQTDPLAYLEELLGHPPREGAPRLPRLAAAWAREQPEARSAIELLRDVEQLERDLRESSSILDQVEHAMSEAHRVQIFPDLALGQDRATSLAARLVATRDRLLALYRGLVIGGGNPGERQSLERLAGERKVLEEGGRFWARSRDQGGDEKTQAAHEDAGRRQRAVSAQVADLGEQLAAVERYAKETPASETETESFRQQAEGIRTLISTLMAEEARLRAAIEAERDKRETASQEREGGSRQDHDRISTEERQLLRALSDRLDSAGRQSHQRLEKLLERAAAVRTTLDRFGAELDAKIESRLREIRGVVNEEREAVARHEEDARALVAEAREAALAAAKASFTHVLRRYHDITVMGDVGILDVAWALKQERSEAVSALVSEQKQEIGLLDEGLEEVMGDSE